MDWSVIVSLAGAILTLCGTVVVAIFGFRGKKVEVNATEKQNTESAIGARWDDASELATKMRAYIEEEVEKQVAPIRQRLADVEAESHELAVAVRSREAQLWMWDIQGRAGHMPLLPATIYAKLGIGHLFTVQDYDSIEQTIQGEKNEPTI